MGSKGSEPLPPYTWSTSVRSNLLTCRSTILAWSSSSSSCPSCFQRGSSSGSGNGLNSVFIQNDFLYTHSDLRVAWNSNQRTCCAQTQSTRRSLFLLALSSKAHLSNDLKAARRPFPEVLPAIWFFFESEGKCRGQRSMSGLSTFATGTLNNGRSRTSSERRRDTR